MEEIRLIYLNQSTIDENLQRQLFDIDPTMQVYTNVSSCFDWIQSNLDQPLFLIVSKECFDDLIDVMDSWQSIISIFIYDDELQDMCRQDSKIIGCYSTTVDLMKSLEDQIQIMEKQIFGYSLFDDKQNLTKESATFIWYYLLLDILTEIPIKSDEYKKNQCSRQSDLHWSIKVFNRAFRTRNIEQLFVDRSLIRDLCLTIERDSEQWKHQEYIIVYRAQMMTKAKIDELKLHIGSYLCSHGFFSAYSDRNRALNIFQQDFSIGEHVLFEIHMDFTIDSIPSLTYEENEILFSLNSIFILQSIDYDPVNHLWHVKISTNNEQRKSLDEHIQLIQKQMHISSTLIFFIRLLWQELNQIQQAEKFYRILLQSLPYLPLDLHIEFGIIQDKLGEYYLALNHYQTALDLRQTQHSDDYFGNACLLNRIGLVYQHMSNLDRAVEFFQQSLEIYEKIPRPITNDQLNVIIEFCEEKVSLFDSYPYQTHLLILLASLYEEKNPKQADRYYQQAATVLEQHPTDEIFEKSLSTMINFYWKCRMFDRALVCQMKLLHFRRAHDQDIAYTLRGIARLYRAMNQLDQALKYFEESLSIFRKNFSSEHLDVKTIEKEIFDLKEILKSISSTAQEDYDYRRSSNAHKQWPMLADIPSSIGNDHRSNSISKSGTCLIL